MTSTSHLGPHLSRGRARAGRLVPLAAAALATLATSSCLVIDGFSDLETAEGAGGGTAQSSTSTATASATSTTTDGAGGAGAGGASTGAGGAGGGPSDRVQVYVSQATGSDVAGDGLSSDQARRTILGALGVLDDLGAEGDILVCEGTYDEEELVITRSISILGGYDCDDWDRPQEAAFPYFPRSVVLEGRPGRTAIVLDGPLVDGSARIEGITVRGGTFGVDVVGGAAPTIEKSILEGGPSEDGPSIALRVDGAPHLDRVELRGGTGHADGDLPGSAGLVVVDGTPILEATSVRGGHGTAGETGLASLGLLVLDGSLVAAAGLRDLSISGGQGESTNPDLTTAGIAILGGDVEIENVVAGGGVPLTATSGSVAVLVATTGEVSIARSILNGGNGQPGVTTRGVHARAAARLDVVNSMIVGGVPSVASDVATVGVHLDGVDAGALGPVTVLHSTIQAQHLVPAAPRDAAPIVIGHSGVVTLGNNLLFTALADAGVSALRLTRCPPNAEISGNAFLGIDPLLTQGPDGCVANAGAASVAALEQDMMDQGFAAAGNLYLGACDVAVPGCAPLACDGPAACAGVVFDGWVSISETLLVGFRLGDGLPCRLVESSQAFGVADDWGGAPREAPPSIGADEAEGCVGERW